MTDVVCNGGAAVVDADAGEGGGPLQSGPGGQVARRADRARQVSDHQPDGLVAIHVVGGVGVAVGRGFDGMHQRIDTGRGGQVRRQPRRHGRDRARSHRLSGHRPTATPSRARHRTAPRCAWLPSPSPRSSAHRRRPVAWPETDSRTDRSGSRSPAARDSGHGLAEIHRRTTAERDHGLGAVAACELGGRVGLRHRRIALDMVEHRDRKSGRPQRALSARDHADRLQARIGHQQHMPRRDGRALQFLDDTAELLERAGTLGDLRHAIQRYQAHGFFGV